ncbi:MAG: hypothetical protein N2320_06125 [Candidatus Bipolaricaulota bacterium]|nr:hypothetical protein [Candidatus Bipolaricaulota bacterium]
MPLLVVLLLLLAVPGAGQSVQAEAPWLTVYDPAGRPKWEVRLGRLVRTATGWEGERVEVQLYSDGAPAVLLRAPRLSADRYGREWTLGSTDAEAVTGEGEGFVFRCREARWSGGLLLRELAAEGRGVTLHAAEVRWAFGEALHLEGAEATFAGWTVRFERGTYEFPADRLTTGPVQATGHGLVLTGSSLQAWPGEGRLILREAELVRAP